MVVFTLLQPLGHKGLKYRERDLGALRISSRNPPEYRRAVACIRQKPSDRDFKGLLNELLISLMEFRRQRSGV